MTSIPQAQPGPPSLTSLMSGLPRNVPSQAHAQASEGSVSREDYDDEVEFIDSRPAKRRKVSTANLLGTPASAVSDTSVMSARSRGDPAKSDAHWLSIAASNKGKSNTVDGPSHSPAQPPPLPTRPWVVRRPQVETQESTRPACRVRKNIAVPTTPDSMSTPEDAPSLEDKRRADYFPWTGRHPEDSLSESTVKQGYFDRAPNPPEKELNTAKAPLYNAFKHRSGLESLSALFSYVLKRKNSHGTFSSVSTFKGPPPRVTLTEVKRKSWIADLANLEVPLRRLSKTIPQGIRGHLLLDQCLLHLVSLSRAIWFIKCVGANEIRTLKRKGINPTVAQGAEAKWLREWTINVEQFLEQLLSQCGQNTWKDRMNYALQLGTRLYAENLLDRDHYLDWITKSFPASHMNHWPFWLMAIYLHRGDLLAFRKRGKQLAETLVNKLITAQEQSPTILEPIIQRLCPTIQTFVQLRPACFLMPDRWADCERVLRQCLDLNNMSQKDLFTQLKAVNERAMGCSNDDTTTKSAQECIIEVLDSARAPYDLSRLATSLLQTCSDYQPLIATCLQWCTSRYRTGLPRIYLTSRLLRRWYKQGFDIDENLRAFIQQSASDTSTIDFEALRHLVSEMSRSHTFSISKYLQWLTVRGLPRSNTFTEASTLIGKDFDGNFIFQQHCEDKAQLLTECCLLGHSGHTRNLRNAVLGRAGFDENNERAILEYCKAYFSLILADPRSPGRDAQPPDLSKLTWSVRTELAHYLRSEVVKLAKASQVQAMQPPLSTHPMITSKQFNIVRNALEELQDIAMLADVLRITAFVKQEDILSTITDTINYHSETMSAMGSLEPLQLLLCQAYLTLRPVKTSMPYLATSLIELCQHYPMKIAPVRALQQDFVRGDRGRAVAACSPFSDGVAESLQQAGETFHDDFEAILQTESNMNEATMNRLFWVLVDRIEKLQTQDIDNTQLLLLCQLLCRLKLCRRTYGDTLLKQWLIKLFNDGVTQVGKHLIINLVATRCIQLDSVVEFCLKLPESKPSRELVVQLIRDATIDNSSNDIDPNLWYAMKLAALNFSKSNPAMLLEVFVLQHDQAGLERVACKLLTPLVYKSDLGNDLSQTASSFLSRKLAAVLDAEHTSAAASTSPALQAKFVVQASNPLSLPFSQLKLRMLCQSVSTSANEAVQDEVASMISTCLDDEGTLRSGSLRIVKAILRATGPVIGSKIRAKAEQSFFQALPKFLQGKTAAHFPLPSEEENRHAAAILQQVSIVNADVSTSVPSPTISLLIEKLSMYLKCLSSSSMGQAGNSQSAGMVSSPVATTTTTPVLTNPDTLRAFLLATLDSLEVIMRMICIKRPTFNPASTQPSPAAAKQSQQDLVKLVGLLITIASHPAWSLLTISEAAMWHMWPGLDKAKNITGFMFDVAATLVDDMAEESRLFCARIMKDKVKDERVKWLLGNTKMFGSVQWQDIGSGLEMSHETKGTVGDFQPKVWEMLESSGGGNDGCLGLGLFEARKL